MGFGDTAKKIQTLADRAEHLIAQLKDVRERVIELEEGIEETNGRVNELENDSEKQLVLLKAIAREQGIDADEVLAEAAIQEAESENEVSEDDEPSADERGAETAEPTGETDEEDPVEDTIEN
ncbi:DUF5798 family protein [Natranaeroarchaeum sulfidigenes]|uniref:Uncharacterized protein n=1 Tax=Natranaeroarchaeum sulfidigenes TaxID=2784880 RepID=A0A897MLI8_9EURY|nr:DUF5798 family protein [Natranaeroarchaeum sulfidigenes]QSG03060.1 Uncharacterized protein AArcS_1851 [Natranaeroarchaeum sulfidigenes]